VIGFLVIIWLLEIQCADLSRRSSPWTCFMTLDPQIL
jgi:hypothetical protein